VVVGSTFHARDLSNPDPVTRPGDPCCSYQGWKRYGYSGPNSFRGVLIRPYPSPDI
jgi:hypothetical protein